MHDVRSERLGCWVRRSRVLLQTYNAWLERMSLGRYAVASVLICMLSQLEQYRKHYTIEQGL
jgi:hypothetical protein